MDKSIRTTTHSEFFDVAIKKTLGMVSGSGAGVVRLAGVFSQGSQSACVEAMEMAKEIALNQIMVSAKALGANAIIKIRFLIQSHSGNATLLCIVAYGTAVVVK